MSMSAEAKVLHAVIEGREDDALGMLDRLTPGELADLQAACTKVSQLAAVSRRFRRA